MKIKEVIGLRMKVKEPSI